MSLAEFSKAFARYDKKNDEKLRPREFQTGIEAPFFRHHRVVGKRGAPSKNRNGKNKANSKGKSGKAKK